MSTPHPLGPSGPRQRKFDPERLEGSVIALPLAEAMRRVRERLANPNAPPYGPDLGLPRIVYNDKTGIFPVIVDLNVEYMLGRDVARHRVYDLVARILRSRSGNRSLADAIPYRFRNASPQFVFADLTFDEIQELVRQDQGMPTSEGDSREMMQLDGTRLEHARRCAIYRIWPSHPVAPLLVRSVRTIKADSARQTFDAAGAGIVWAVLDSGIDADHPHFATQQNLLDLPLGVTHKDFTDAQLPEPLIDRFGHGTHVAGIIAGTNPQGGRALTVFRDEQGRRTKLLSDTGPIAGVAPKCKLVSFKVLDHAGNGDVRSIMAALEEVARINRDGREIRIHGVNLSLGYPFDPEWFACGQSPLCEVVNRLVRSGVVVVAAAGNTGYAFFDIASGGQREQGASMSINDPGNADHAVTVGSTHGEAPHRYGASYFSSKGPTGDGRLKPDLLAPGEKIVSCNSTHWRNNTAGEPTPHYREESGTSMAAPHVSGAIAAFLSVRREFIGESERVKQIFMQSATDLRRDRYLQGAGLVDVLRALQSI